MATLTDRWDEGAAPGERFLGRLRDRLVAGDPAFSRLRLSSRAILSLLLSLALLIGVHFLVHPITLAAYGMAVVISFLGAMGVTDKGAAAQAVTRAYGFGIAVVLFFIAGLLAARPQVAFPVLLVVIFGAAYVRKFGQRWFGLGMVAFMSYFMGDYLRPAPSDIGWIAFAVALTFAVTQLVTTIILRDDPERDFRRALKTIDRRINLILRVLLDGAGQQAGLDRKLLTRHLERLRDIVLMAEGFIPQGEAGSLAAAGAASDLAVALFELQLIVERLVGFVLANGPPPAELVQAVLYRDGAAMERMSARPAQDGAEEPASHLLMRVDWSRRRLETVLGAQPSAAFRLKAGAIASAPAQPAAGAGRQFGLIRLSRDFELPIQMTLACGVALSCGLLLSSVRWYWAVFAAFLVFSNAKSRADTALRALHRSAGTLAGLVGGTAVATLLQGQPILSGALIPVLFFIAFYFVQTSYGTMIFFVTIGLALLYGVLGMFTPGLLVLRLAETVLGAVAGTLVAFLVFPAPASQTAAGALDKYLQALDDLISAAQRRAHGEPEPQHLLARSRLLDRSYTDLANAVRPLGGPWRVVTRFGEVRERLLLLTACAHWGRVLARGLKPDSGLAPESVIRIDTLANEVRQRIGEAEAVREVYFERPEASAPSEIHRPPLPVGNDDDPLFALEVISALLWRATRDPSLRQA